MNLSEEAELDHILAGVDYTECDEAMKQPGSTPELMGVVRSPMNDTGGAEEMVHREWSGGELLVEGGSCGWPFSLSLMDQLVHICNNSYTIISLVNFIRSPKQKLIKTCLILTPVLFRGRGETLAEGNRSLGLYSWKYGTQKN